jgi:hypothetical protein
VDLESPRRIVLVEQKPNREIVTPDAVIDYTETGGVRGTVEEIKRWLPVALKAAIPRYQHMVATTQLKLDGDRATGVEG